MLLNGWLYGALTHSQTTNLDFSKPKEFADDNLRFYINGMKFSNQVQNNVEKGEIARNEQFLRFPQCFQKAFLQTYVKTRVCLGKGYATLTAKVISWRSVTHICFLAFSHQYLHNFISKITYYFPHMHQQGCEAKIRENTPESKLASTGH